MKREEFTADAPGQLVDTAFAQPGLRDGQPVVEEARGPAFVPDPLPPKLDVRSLVYEIHDAIVRAERQLSLLEGTARRLKNPHLLIRVFGNREAMLSSRIENTIASANELALVRHGAADRDEVREVYNYVRALEYGLADRRPISLNLIRDLHAILLSDVPHRGVNPGEFRRTQNAIGRIGGFRDAVFVPPPADRVPECLHYLERFIHATEPSLPNLVKLALIHYQFEAIHPFLDGNGRVGRLLVTLYLCRHGQLSQPLLYISAFLERHRATYYELLKRVSTHGDWIVWVRFFLRAVETQATDGVRRADSLFLLHERYHQLVRAKRQSSLLPHLVDMLFDNPGVTNTEVQQRLDCTAQTAANLINKLVERGVLVEATGKLRDRIFVAPEIIDLIQYDFEDLEPGS